jgi:hypothetical protein
MLEVDSGLNGVQYVKATKAIKVNNWVTFGDPLLKEGKATKSLKVKVDATKAIKVKIKVIIDASETCLASTFHGVKLLLRRLYFYVWLGINFVFTFTS